MSETGDVSEAGGFDTPSRAMAINNDSIYRAAEGRIEVCNTGGTVKQTLAFDEMQGSPVSLTVTRDYLAAVTDLNYVRVYKVAGREAKPHAGPGLVIPLDFSHLQVDQVAVNTAGNMVSVLVSSKEHATEPKMFVYCSEVWAVGCVQWVPGRGSGLGCEAYVLLGSQGGGTGSGKKRGARCQQPEWSALAPGARAREWCVRQLMD